MKLALDLDHTLIDFVIPWWKIAAEYANRINGNQNVLDEQPSEYSKEIYNKAYSQKIDELWRSNWYMVDLAYFKNGVSNMLMNIKSFTRVKEIYLVTSRYTEVQCRTSEFINKTHIRSLIDGLVFSDGDKLQFLKDAKIDVFIDDNPKEIENAVSAGILSCVFEQNWNKELIKKNICNKCSDVKEMERFIRFATI